jgi:uncharacterized phage infection (PIP) family protein YhgE
MHEMDRTPKILTIIGLVFEVVGIIGMFIGAYFMMNLQNFSFMTPEILEITQDEFDMIIDIYTWIGNLLIGMGIIMGVFLIINLFLFPKLIKSKYTEESAKKVYLYQAIWGGLNLLFNQVVGVLYLISGVTGYNGHVEERDIRDGI